MQTQVVYQFPTAQLANRFLNEVNSSQLPHIKAKLFKGSDKVQISYQFHGTGFDTTGAELDDLASRYQGTELH